MSNPDVHAISISYIDAVLGADSPYPLFPSASSTPCFLARILQSECMNFFHSTHSAAVSPPCLRAVPFFLFSNLAPSRIGMRVRGQIVCL